MSYPTCRVFHRNSDLAFPRTARYGAAIERPDPTGQRMADIVLAVVIGVAMAAALCAWWAS